jgi:FAD/FMN-containing dehydrogenase
VALPLLMLARPLVHLALTTAHDTDGRSPVPAGHADDASGLSLTAVAEVVPVDADPARAERQLVELLRTARARGLRVSIAGARHSMGGHTIAPGGVQLDLRGLRHLRFDAATQRVTCGAGALWSDVLAALHAHGRSLDVVQSFSNFTVGGSMKVLTADGRVRRCSRTEEPALFSLVAGGYGLFGVILEAEVRTVPDAPYRLVHSLQPTDRLEAAYAPFADDPAAALVFARLDVTPGERFLRESLLNVFVDDPTAKGPGPAPGEQKFVKLRREVLRGSAGSAYGKELRWTLETQVEEHFGDRVLWRNQLLLEDWALFENRDPARTEVLQEYFVPRGALAPFVAELRRLVPAHPVADLMNVTIRWVKADADTFLRWADRDLVCIVLLFQHARTAADDEAMVPLTRGLVDAALKLGGRHYLPYRLQPTRAQLVAAYPMFDELLAKKKELDPDGLFTSMFLERYAR